MKLLEITSKRALARIPNDLSTVFKEEGLLPQEQAHKIDDFFHDVIAELLADFSFHAKAKLLKHFYQGDNHSVQIEGQGETKYLVDDILGANILNHIQEQEKYEKMQAALLE